MSGALKLMMAKDFWHHEFVDFGSDAVPLGEGWRLAAASGILRRATMKLVSMVER